jgi:ABC-type Co2+ transport system permease subunit
MSDDAANTVVLAVFGGSLVTVIVGYLVAWRGKRRAVRKAGSLLVAAVAGFAGLFISSWMIGSVMPLPPPDGTSIWAPLAVLLVFSPFPVGAFYICARFTRQALRNDRPESKAPADSHDPTA